MNKKKIRICSNYQMSKKKQYKINIYKLMKIRKKCSIGEKNTKNSKRNAN